METAGMDTCLGQGFASYVPRKHRRFRPPGVMSKPCSKLSHGRTKLSTKNAVLLPNPTVYLQNIGPFKYLGIKVVTSSSNKETYQVHPSTNYIKLQGTAAPQVVQLIFEAHLWGNSMLRPQSWNDLQAQAPTNVVTSGATKSPCFKRSDFSSHWWQLVKWRMETGKTSKNHNKEPFFWFDSFGKGLVVWLDQIGIQNQDQNMECSMRIMRLSLIIPCGNQTVKPG